MSTCECLLLAFQFSGHLLLFLRVVERTHRSVSALAVAAETMQRAVASQRPVAEHIGAPKQIFESSRRALLAPRAAAGPSRDTGAAHVDASAGPGWAAAAVATMASALCFAAPLDAAAAQRTRQPPVAEQAGRCEVAALDKFADTRATFSQEASGGNMAEAVVDIRDCDFSKLDLSGKVCCRVGWRGGIVIAWRCTHQLCKRMRHMASSSRH